MNSIFSFVAFSIFLSYYGLVVEAQTALTPTDNCLTITLPADFSDYYYYDWVSPPSTCAETVVEFISVDIDAETSPGACNQDYLNIWKYDGSWVRLYSGY